MASAKSELGCLPRVVCVMITGAMRKTGTPGYSLERLLRVPSVIITEAMRTITAKFELEQVC